MFSANKGHSMWSTLKLLNGLWQAGYMIIYNRLLSTCLTQSRLSDDTKDAVYTMIACLT